MPRVKLNEHGVYERHERLLREYLANGGDTIAAIRAAGYKCKYPERRFHDIVNEPNVAKRLEELRAECNKRLDTKADDILQALYDNALSVLSDFATWDGEGNIKFKPSSELSRGQAGCIKKLSSTTRTFTAKGGGKTVTKKVDLELNDGLKAKDMAMRQLELYPKEKAPGKFGEEDFTKMAEALESARAQQIAHYVQESGVKNLSEINEAGASSGRQKGI